MKIYSIDTPEDVIEVAERFWDIALEHNPNLVKLMVKALKDPDLDKRDLIHLGFTFGAMFALGEFTQGHIRDANHG